MFKTFQACSRHFKLIQAIQNIPSLFNTIQHHSMLFKTSFNTLFSAAVLHDWWNVN
jgi:hypothetical protein